MKPMHSSHQTMHEPIDRFSIAMFLFFSVLIVFVTVSAAQHLASLRGTIGAGAFLGILVLAWALVLPRYVAWNVRERYRYHCIVDDVYVVLTEMPPLSVGPVLIEKVSGWRGRDAIRTLRGDRVAWSTHRPKRGWRVWWQYHHRPCLGVEDTRGNRFVHESATTILTIVGKYATIGDALTRLIALERSVPVIEQERDCLAGALVQLLETQQFLRANGRESPYGQFTRAFIEQVLDELYPGTKPDVRFARSAREYADTSRDLLRRILHVDR